MDPVQVEQRVVTEHAVMLELQRAMLPAGLPVLPDLNLAAGYRAAARAGAAGGDWFDVVPMPGGAVGLVVGDVVGHGATAAAVMGQLRAITAERLGRGGLDEVVLALDAFAASSADARASTVCLAVLDRRTGLVRYALRGHPPPAVVGTDGATRFLPGAAGPPLALRGSGGGWERDVLAPGETLLLYTDGAVVRPGRTFAAGKVTLATRLASVTRRAAELQIAPAMCAAVTGASAGHDDVGVLAATRLSAPPEPLTVVMPATVEQLGKVRKLFSSWLGEFQAGEDDVVALELSTVEAVTNSIEHAYNGLPGLMRVDATLDHAGVVRVVVGDDGRWKPPPADPGFRGRGLIMMREFSDQFTLDISPGGTTVTLDKALRRPVLLDGTPKLTTPVAELQIDVHVRQDAAVISLAGALDASGIDDLLACLFDVERVESLPVIINLDRLSLLASAGLRTLYEHAHRLRLADRTLRVVAAETSVAREVLRVSGLDELVSPAGGG